MTPLQSAKHAICHGNSVCLFCPSICLSHWCKLTMIVSYKLNMSYNLNLPARGSSFIHRREALNTGCVWKMEIFYSIWQHIGNDTRYGDCYHSDTDSLHLLTHGDFVSIDHFKTICSFGPAVSLWQLCFLGRPYVVTGGLLFYPWCFFFSPPNLRALSADRRETLPHIGTCVNFINRLQKFGELSPLTNWGQKHAKFPSILYNLRLWSRISPERFKISKIWKRFFPDRFLLHSTKKVWWTLVL